MNDKGGGGCRGDPCSHGCQWACENLNRLTNTEQQPQTETERERERESHTHTHTHTHTDLKYIMTPFSAVPVGTNGGSVKCAHELRTRGDINRRHRHTDTDTQTQTHTQSQKANVWDGYVESRVRMSLDRGTAGKGESCEARGWRPSRAAWPVQMDRGSNKEGGQDEKIQNQRQFCVRVYACVRLSVSVRGLCLCSWHASHVHRGPPCVS